MTNQLVQFNIDEAGSLLYLADRSLKGHRFSQISEAFDRQGGLRELTLGGAIMAMGLYQDNGYSVRIVGGALTPEEESQWTSKVTWKLDLASGRLVVSGVSFEGFDEYLEDFETAENDGEYEFGCYVDLAPGAYRVDVYSYPPNDLAGGLLVLEDRRKFRRYFGESAPFEKTIDYFNRTHPGQTAPDWITQGYEDSAFLDFVVELTPLAGDPAQPQFADDENCLKWIHRKPEICPVGIRIQES
jgi:hypothetical protein